MEEKDDQGGGFPPFLEGVVMRQLIKTRFVFLLPGLFFMSLFVLVPIVSIFFISFYSWNLLSPMRFIGWANFKRMISDQYFWNSLVVTFKLMGLGVPINFFLSLSLALALYREDRFSKIFRAIFYWPCLMPAIAGATMWKWMLSHHTGLFNYILRTLGLSPIYWLEKPLNALFSVVLSGIWGAGFFMMMFITGLQNIPHELIEAARIDGANKWQTFWHVTFPLLKNTNLLVLMVSVAYSLRSFAGIYALTGGGPGYATTNIALYIYRSGLTQFRIGYAYAMSVIYFVLALVVGLIILRLQREE